MNETYTGKVDRSRFVVDVHEEEDDTRLKVPSDILSTYIYANEPPEGELHRLHALTFTMIFSPTYGQHNP